MKDSEFKAMKWSGNIYHKFGGIIPDVNDINIQGTFKYVESHVNTVGGSFKKFCSGVAQDLFPPSMDPEEELKADEATLGSRDDSGSVATEDRIDCGENVDELRLAKHSESHGFKSSEMRENDWNGVKECEEGPFREPVDSAKHGNESVVSTSARNHETSCALYDLGVAPPSSVSEVDPSSTSSLRRSLSDSFNAVDLTERISDTLKDPSSSSTLTSASLKLKDESSLDIAADLGMETISLNDEVKLGESCVFVDDTLLYAVSRRARKLASYKKKFQDLFTSKKRLAKEYEQLAIWYGDADIDSGPNPNPHNSQTRQACDSEWELL